MLALFSVNRIKIISLQFFVPKLSSKVLSASFLFLSAKKEEKTDGELAQIWKEGDPGDGNRQKRRPH